MALIAACLLIASGLIRQALPRFESGYSALPDSRSTAVTLDISVLVFREGLECILVLAAITASMAGSRQTYQRPVAVGAGIAFVSTLVTWCVAARIVDDLTENIPALTIQVVTGLLAVLVLVIVMNWFFHKVYWTGWISLHNKKKQHLLKNAEGPQSNQARVVWGLGLLGFTSLYREGVEVVLFLQSYRIKVGGGPVLNGVLIGLLLSGIVAVLTFVAHRRLPYKKMLVLTGAMLGVVLLVMVGEEAQEMQLAHWLPTTAIPWLEKVIPSWSGLWLSVFPTVETLAAQALAAALVLGSYFLTRIQGSGHAQIGKAR
jgi:high-affinity iron transporter